MSYTWVVTYLTGFLNVISKYFCNSFTKLYTLSKKCLNPYEIKKKRKMQTTSNETLRKYYCNFCISNNFKL